MAKGSRRRADVFASAADDLYTVNDLQLKRERQKGRFQVDTISEPQFKSSQIAQ